LDGKKVITKDSVDVGEIHGAVMDDYWRIEYLLLVLNKETCNKLGFVQPLMGHVTLCLPVHIIKDKTQVIRLDKTLDELRVLPYCKTS
jgi:hypothetical protein